jgi:hypothetical protein
LAIRFALRSAIVPPIFLIRHELLPLLVRKELHELTVKTPPRFPGRGMKTSICGRSV